MALKRKRVASYSSNNRKRQKAPAHPHGDFDPEKLYKLKSICGETTTHYLIDWEDDPETGKKFKKSWEPKENVNAEAVEDWEYSRAEEKRLEERSSGQVNRSRSASSNNQLSKAPRKSVTPARRKGRLRRRVIDSSPQPAESSAANGHIDEHTQHQPEEFLEICESPVPSPAPSPTKEGDAASPLFEPLETPAEHGSPGESNGAVHLPPPPSSYLAGDYQTVSTQANASSSPAKDSPEPSQYQPDPADTSYTTVNTSVISVAPSTPPQQAQSVPVNFGSSSVKIVPDSQSIRGSSSYVTSTTVTTPFSAPESRRTEPHNEANLTAATSEAEASTETIHNSQSRPQREIPDPSPPKAPAEEDAFVTEASDTFEQDATEGASEHQSQDKQSEGNLETTPQSGPVPASSSAPVQAESERLAEAPATPGNIELPAEAHTDINNSADVEEDERNSATSNPESRDRLEESKSLVEDVHSPKASGSTSGETQQQQILKLGAEQPPEPIENLNHLETATNRTLQPNSVSQVDKGSNERRDTEQSARPSSPVQPADSYTSCQPQQNSVAAPHIDLTETQIQADPSGITVTPPQRRPLSASENRRFPVQQLNSSIWQSSPFPFQTKLPGLQGAEPTHSNSASPRSDFVSQQQSEDRARLRGGSEFSPLALSQPLVQQSTRFSPGSRREVSSQPIGINAFGESAPVRSKAPSSPLRPPSQESIMEHSQPSASLAARLAATRQAAKERRAAQRSATPSTAPPSEASKTTSPTAAFKPDAAPVAQPAVPPKLASPFLMPDDRVRSPSVVPALEPLPVITRDEMNTSRRVETLLPQSQDRSEQAEQNGSLTAPETPVLQETVEQDPETAGVHVVPIYLIGHQRDHYPEVVYHYRALVAQYLGSDAPDGLLVNEAKLFVDRIRRVVIHPDLDNIETSYTQYDVPASQQAKWDVDCSAKFRFLRDLLDALRHSKVHIVLVVQPGRIIEILETFLQGIRVSYTRVGTANPVVQGDVTGNVHVSLLPADATASVKRADLIIAMDNSINYTSEQIRTVRHLDGKWAPYVTLVVPRSVEHIERSLSPTLSDRTRTRALVSGIRQHCEKAGKTLDGQPAPKDTARLIAEYLTSAEQDREWPLPPLANLEDLDSQTDSEIDIVVSNADPSFLTVLGEKRLREDDESTHTSELQKRSRVESPVTGAIPDASTNPQDVDTTHISDSVSKATEDAETSALSLTSNEKRLQDLLIAAQDRLDECMKDLGDLQYRTEEQRRKLVEVTVERDHAIETAQKALNRLGEESNRMSTLRNENSALKEQLKGANSKLVDHSIPERAELESLRLQLEQAAVKEEKAEKRVEQANKDVAYVRELYQNSSKSAQSLSIQVAELENQLSVAQNKATGEQIKLRNLSYDALTKDLQDENKKLKAMMKDRDAALKFRDEEIAKLKEASRGRMGTRGTSVPRSPRMGSPRIGSRQTSPAAGELRGGRNALLHPLRNAES